MRKWRFICWATFGVMLFFIALSIAFITLFAINEHNSHALTTQEIQIDKYANGVYAIFKDAHESKPNRTIACSTFADRVKGMVWAVW